MNLQQQQQQQQADWLHQAAIHDNGNASWGTFMEETNSNTAIEQPHVSAFHLDVSVHSPMSLPSVSSTPSSNPSRSFVTASGPRGNRLGSFHTPHSTNSTPTSNSIHSTPSRHAKRVREDEDEPLSLSARAINFNQMSDLMMSTSPVEGEFNQHQQQRQDGSNQLLGVGETFRPPKMQKLSLQISPTSGVNASYSASCSPFVANNLHPRPHFPSASQPTSVSASPNLFPLNDTPAFNTASHLPPTHASVFSSIVSSPSSPFVQQQTNSIFMQHTQHQPIQLQSPHQQGSFSSIPPPIPLGSARQQSLPVVSSFAFNQMQNGTSSNATQNQLTIHQQQQQEQHRQEQILQLRELQRQYHQQQQHQQQQLQQQQQILSVPFRPASAPLFNGNGGRPVQSIVSPDNIINVGNGNVMITAEIPVNSMEEQDEVAHPSTPSCNSPSHCSSTTSLTQLARNYSANESSGNGSGRGVRGMIPNVSTVSIPSSLQSSHPTSPSEPASRSYIAAFRSSSPTELTQSVSLSASTASFPAANYAPSSHLAVHGGGVAASELHSPASSAALPIHAPIDLHSGYMGGVEIGQGILIMSKCRGLSPTNASNVDGFNMASSPRANAASPSPRGHKRTVTSAQQFVLMNEFNASSEADGMED